MPSGPQITTLIDKLDTSEIIRDEIAAILAVELQNQELLAAADNQDPRGWAVDVFSERTNPWQAFIDAPVDPADVRPLVNVWFDSWQPDKGRSNVVKRQQGAGIFNVDCYGYGVSTADETGTGHILGDAKGATEAQRALKLCRNILMSGHYTYLGFQGTDIVGGREVSAINTFQPPIDSRELEKVQAARLAIAVSYNEFSPQVVPVELELVSVQVKREIDGKIIVVADFPMTPP